MGRKSGKSGGNDGWINWKGDGGKIWTRSGKIIVGKVKSRSDGKK